MRGIFLCVPVDVIGLETALRQHIVEKQTGARAALTVGKTVPAFHDIRNALDILGVALGKHKSLRSAHAFDEHHFLTCEIFADIRNVVLAALRIEQMHGRNVALSFLQSVNAAHTADVCAADGYLLAYDVDDKVVTAYYDEIFFYLRKWLAQFDFHFRAALITFGISVDEHKPVGFDEAHNLRRAAFERSGDEFAADLAERHTHVFGVFERTDDVARKRGAHRATVVARLSQHTQYHGTDEQLENEIRRHGIPRHADDGFALRPCQNRGFAGFDCEPVQEHFARLFHHVDGVILRARRTARIDDDKVAFAQSGI